MRKLFKASGKAKDWAKKKGIITWKDKGFSWGDKYPPHISAKDYYDYKLLGSTLPNVKFQNALDLGCGYGRRTGWINEFAAETTGIDPNNEAVDEARACYPHLRFHVGAVQKLPFDDQSFDLICTFVVLQHVPPDVIEVACSEMRRVLKQGGHIICFEAVGQRVKEWRWERSVEEYERVFNPLKLSECQVRTFPKEKSSVHMMHFVSEE